MAEVMNSLFGVSPESLQAQRQAMFNKQAMDYATLGDPFKQANYAIYSGAANATQGIGGLLGAQDPEMMRIQQRQGMLQNLDLTSPESLKQGIQTATQNKDYQLVSELTNRYQSTVKAGLEGRKTEAEIAAKLGEKLTPEQKNAAGLADAAGLTRGTQEWQDAYSKSLKGLTDKNEPTAVVETADGVFLVNKLTGERISRVGSAPQRGTTITNAPILKSEEAYGGTVGKASGEQDVGLITQATKSANALPKRNETKKLIDSGNINTGLGSSLQDVMNQARSKFLADEKAGVNVRDSQYLDSLLGSDVFGQISALGIGARGIDTPAEREFLRQVITGTRQLNKETLAQMVNMRIKSAEGSVNEYNKALSEGNLNKYQETTRKKLSPLSHRGTPYASIIQQTIAHNASIGKPGMTEEQAVTLLKQAGKIPKDY